MNTAAPWARMILVLSLVGCGTEPSIPILRGSWGGSGIGLVATSQRVVMTMACQTSAVIGGPIQVDPAGEFELHGSLESPYSSSEMQVTGRVRGDLMEITLTLPQPEPPDFTTQFLLRHGWPAEYGDPVCPG